VPSGTDGTVDLKLMAEYSRNQANVLEADT